MSWKEVIGGILVGTLLGVAATFFTLYKKIIDVESQLNQHIASVERRLEVGQTPSSLSEGSADATQSDVASPKDGGSARIIFTTGLDESNNPKNDLDSFKLGVDGALYVYVNHFGLTPGKTYERIIKIFDSNNDLIHEVQYSFRSQGAAYNSWASYTPKEGIDRPGIWTVKVEVNGIVVSSRSIRVRLP